MGDPSKNMTCQQHGQSYATYLCQHLAKGTGLGFYYGNEVDPRPDAWCYECDKKLCENNGEWSEEIEDFVHVTMICANCYDIVRRQNEIPHKRIHPISRPTIEEDGWELANARQISSLHPDTFRIPSEIDIESLKENDLVKLLFAFEDQNGFIGIERMWVQITEVNGNEFSGSLETDPVLTDAIKREAKVVFNKDHIASMIVPSNDNRLEGQDPPNQQFKASSWKENEAYY